MSKPWLSIIVPVLNEADGIVDFLEKLRAILDDGCELLLVDGGSVDRTPELIRAGGFTLLTSARGRARQLVAGAAAARGDVLWLLHSDSKIPGKAIQLIRQAWGAGMHWGRFDVRLSGTGAAFRMIETSMNLRSRLTGICTGDQGIFLSRSAHDRIGGIPCQDLMEDIELSRRLKRLGRPACIRVPLETSSRRWQEHGVVRTMVLMWWLRLRYYFGTDPIVLERRYYRRGQS